MREFTDFWGLPINVGDTVAYLTLGRKAGWVGNVAIKATVVAIEWRDEGYYPRPNAFVCLKRPVIRRGVTKDETVWLHVDSRSWFREPPCVV